MAKEDEIIPSIGDLLRSTQEARQSVHHFVENDADREQNMLLLMGELEKVNLKGAPNLYATIGGGNDRLIISTIPYVIIKTGKEFVIPSMETFKGAVTNWLQVNINYPVVSKKGFFTYYDHFQGKMENWDMQASDVDNLLNPFNKQIKDYSEFPVFLRTFSSGRDQVHGIAVRYEADDSEQRYPIFSFSVEWKQKNTRFGKGTYFCTPDNSEEGIKMLMHTQEIYRNAIEVKNEQNRNKANAATRLITILNEKRKRGKNKN